MRRENRNEGAWISVELKQQFNTQKAEIENKPIAVAIEAKEFQENQTEEKIPWKQCLNQRT